MQRSQEYLSIAGLFVLVGACILLFSSPEDIFSSQMVIDVSKDHKTSYEMLVTTVLDFRKTGELSRLPTNIGGLESRDLSITDSEASMGALVKRMYSNENTSILFLLMSSRNMSEFHNLEICYSGSWNITDKEVIEIKTGKPGESGYNSIHVNKFIVQKSGLEMIVLHWFMWDGGLMRNDKNFMLIQVGVPVDTTQEDANEKAEGFVKDFFMKLYKPVQKSKAIGEQMIDGFGIIGGFIDLLLIVVPLLMIFNSYIIKK